MGRGQATRSEELAPQASNLDAVTSSAQLTSSTAPLTTAKYLELLHPPDSRGTAFLSRNHPPNQSSEAWHWRDQGVAPANLVTEGIGFARGADRYVSMN